jgi:hypothetical protein
MDEKNQNVLVDETLNPRNFPTAVGVKVLLLIA